MLISKTKYLAGLQCLKLLWYHYNRRDEIPAPDPGTQARMDAGTEVGRIAHRKFPGGQQMEWTRDILKMVGETKKAIAKRTPVYEAALEHGSMYSIADILAPVAGDKWDIVEVKSSTEIKDYHLHDVAFQKKVCEGAGLKIKSCNLMVINSGYVRKGDLDPGGLFIMHDVTGEAEQYGEGIEESVKQMVRAIKTKKCPDIDIGPHCSDPFGCPLMDKCRAKLPEHNVFTLYRGNKKAWEWYNDGISALKDIPEDAPLSDTQAIQVEAVRKGRTRVDRNGIRDFLKTLEYPLSFLDFETYAPAIPLFDDTHPYQTLPFQFSLHVAENEGAKPAHESFIFREKGDPRKAFMASLEKALPSKGSIVMYNSGYEMRIMGECADVLPGYKKWFEGVSKREVDLLSPFRGFLYYNPCQMGSASFKAVLPALTGKGYDGMDISDGMQASLEYFRVTFGEADDKERAKIYRWLEEYCGLDSLGMWMVVKELKKMSG